MDQTIIHANDLLHRPQFPRLLFFHSDKIIGYEFQVNPRHINETGLALSTMLKITLLEAHVFNLGVIVGLHYVIIYWSHFILSGLNYYALK